MNIYTADIKRIGHTAYLSAEEPGDSENTIIVVYGKYSQIETMILREALATRGWKIVDTWEEQNNDDDTDLVILTDMPWRTYMDEISQLPEVL
jgi:ABC-type Fe3+-hydroxamate transport system substrate-binding protein